MLTLYPAIDLIDGRCVRLKHGDFAQKTQYPAKPEELAASYFQAGSEWLHLIDLDAAKSLGQQAQLPLIERIIQASGLKIQCGGGIQSSKRLKQLFALGMERAIVGSLCVKAPETVNKWLDDFGPERIVLALDIRYQEQEPCIALHGWQKTSQETLYSVLAQFPSVRHVLCTDIEHDGTLSGPNFTLYRELRKRFPQIQVQASGGIAALSDLDQLQQDEISGAVLGKSLLEGRFGLKEALQRCKTLQKVIS